MVGLQTLDLAIGVRVPASQPKPSRPITEAVCDWKQFFAGAQLIASKSCRQLIASNSKTSRKT
jgi:hypothetical protein